MVNASADEESVRILRNLGYQVNDIQSIARDQRAFAVRIPKCDYRIARGVRFSAESVELGHGHFTNSYTLSLDHRHAMSDVISTSIGIYLRDALAFRGAVAAISGSFSFSSDDPSYKPQEPCLDFCCREGKVVSLPTVNKPAFLIYDRVPVIKRIPARGRLLIGNKSFHWIGSKEASLASEKTPALQVFGAANCKVEYIQDERTGFLRFVDRKSNVTPRDPNVIDCTVSPSRDGHVISHVQRGGGVDLFAGSFVLRAAVDQEVALRVGMRVSVTHLGELEVRKISSGISIGPSAAEAVRMDIAGFDDCLGTSPFNEVRHARTLVHLGAASTIFKVFDGAPHGGFFRGATPQETADRLIRQGVPPEDTYHLDGGQSSKMSFLRDGNSIMSVGSMHYLRWPTGDDKEFRWRGLTGRNLNSCFSINLL